MGFWHRLYTSCCQGSLRRKREARGAGKDYRRVKEIGRTRGERRVLGSNAREIDRRFRGVVGRPKSCARWLFLRPSHRVETKVCEGRLLGLVGKSWLQRLGSHIDHAHGQASHWCTCSSWRSHTCWSSILYPKGISSWQTLRVQVQNWAKLIQFGTSFLRWGSTCLLWVWMEGSPETVDEQSWRLDLILVRFERLKRDYTRKI